MQKVGKTLQLAREERGFTVEDMARKTRIPRATIADIELGLTDSLPPMVYVRGFIRSYAKELGLDPEALSAQMSRSGLESPTDSSPTQSNVPRLHGGMGSAPYRVIFSDLPEHPKGLLSSQFLFAVLAVGMLIAGWVMAGTDTGSEKVTVQHHQSLPTIQNTVEGVTAYTQTSERAQTRK
jgi:transcriptional regulator with XRE-family HTH domain